MFGAVLTVGLVIQNAESVIRGYKGATLYAEPATRVLEDLELADNVELVVRGGDDGSGGAAFVGVGAGGAASHCSSQERKANEKSTLVPRWVTQCAEKRGVVPRQYAAGTGEGSTRRKVHRHPCELGTN